MSVDWRGDGAPSRIDEGSDWFARMRGPDADASREEFIAWLADPENARAYSEIEAIWSAAGIARGAQVPQPVRAGGIRSIKPHRAWARPALAVAAVAVAAIAVALLLSGYGRSAAPQRAATAYASAEGQKPTVVLADGSHVTLDTASRIIPAFSQGARRVTLVSGRARFAVAPDPQRPFIVLAGGRAVIAHGTIFDMRLDGDALEVTLLEGRVAIEKRAGGPRTRPRAVFLSPGQRAVMHQMDGPVRVEGGVRPAASWTQGMISADATPLADVLREANRHSSRQIELAEPDLGALRVTGAFKPGDAQALGAALSAALDLTIVSRADGSVLLTRRPV